MRIRHAALMVLGVLAAATVACGGAGGSDQPSATAGAASDEAAAYLAEIGALGARLEAQIGQVEESLAGTYETRGRLFTVLTDADLPATFESLLADAEDLDPPEQYAADHRLLLEVLRDAHAGANRLEDAIESDDLVGVALATADMLLAGTRLQVDASPELCDALALDLPLGCAPDDPPDSEYEADILQIFRRHAAEFGPRAGAFPPAFSEEDRFATLAAVQPGIVETIENSLDALGELDPPAEFQDDHQALIAYLEETLDTARAITGAAENADFEETEELFIRSATVLCDARLSLSSAMLEELGFFFDDETCPEPETG